MTKPDLAKELKNLSEQDRKQIEKAQEMLGPDPATMGFVKNLFWGNFREELVFPYPSVSAEEMARCDQLVAALDDYLHNEHPTLEIDQTQQIPEWAIKRLFELGVMGMIIPPRVWRRRLRADELQPRPQAHRPVVRLDRGHGLRPPVDRVRRAQPLRDRGPEAAVPPPDGERHAQRVLPQRAERGL